MDGYTLVKDPTSGKSNCVACQSHVPGCLTCSKTSSICQKCGSDGSGNQLFLLSENSLTSCILCTDSQQKKDVSSGESIRKPFHIYK